MVISPVAMDTLFASTILMGKFVNAWAAEIADWYVPLTVGGKWIDMAES
jgi:hypothetical protein